MIDSSVPRNTKVLYLYQGISWWLELARLFRAKSWNKEESTERVDFYDSLERSVCVIAAN